MHGGRDHSEQPTSRTQLSYVRMFDIFRGLQHDSQHAAVYLLRFRVRGWNRSLPGRTVPDPVRDARETLDILAERHRGAPIALVGHSMGARAAFAVAGHHAVAGVCGLAPWLPPGEALPSEIRDRLFVIAHGTSDRMTSEPATFDYAERLRATGASVMRFCQQGGRHAMLQHPGDWRRLAVRVGLATAGDSTLPRVVADALTEPSPGGLTVPLERIRSA